MNADQRQAKREAVHDLILETMEELARAKQFTSELKTLVDLDIRMRALDLKTADDTNQRGFDVGETEQGLDAMLGVVARK